MNVFLAKKGKTGKALAQALELPTNIDGEADVVIRWGSTVPLIGQRTLNSIEAIKKASDKALCRKLFHEAGIPVPLETETDYPLVGRPKRHSQGKQFYYCENPIDRVKAIIKGAEYFSQYYPKENEYRVHIGSDKVLLMSIKEGDKTQLIWNKRKSGFQFRHLRRSVWLEDEHLRQMTRIAKKVLHVVGLDFGAVDIMADAQGDYAPFVISEVNTAPSLSPLALTKYVAYFKKELSID